MSGRNMTFLVVAAVALLLANNSIYVIKQTERGVLLQFGEVVDRDLQPTTVETHRRHDPCVGIRATPIAEAMLALVVMDHALRQRAQCGDVRHELPPIPGQAEGT